MAAIAQQAAQANGPVITGVTIGATDTFKPHPRGVLTFQSSGTPSNITFTVPGTDDLLQNKPDPVIALGATEFRAVAAGLYAPYADASGDVTYTSSSQTGVTVRYIVV